MATSPAASPCPVLDELPAELRNNIYDHLFAFDASETRHLAECAAPPKAITQICRKIRHEAITLHRTAFRHFWSSSQFELVREDDNKKPDWSIHHLRNEDLKHITKLTVKRGHGVASPDYTVYQLLDTRGGWIKSDKHDRDAIFQITAGSLFGRIKLDWKNWGTKERTIGGLDKASRHATMKEQLTLLLNLNDRDPAREEAQMKEMIKAAGLYGDEAWADPVAAEARFERLMMAMAMAGASSSSRR